MKQIAVIPARSGSKGLKDKNIKVLNGKPMMAYTIEAALNSKLFDCVHVSTDSAQYASIAKQYGADVPFLRDKELADSKASTWDALRDVIQKYKEAGREFDAVTLLQPTSPLRSAADIREAHCIFQEKNADSVVSVCQMEHPIQICNTLGENGSLYQFLDSNRIGARQDQAVYYRINGAIYILKLWMLLKKENIYNKNSYAYIMSKAHSVDIDDYLDFKLAEILAKENF